jgi:hypothetical protein
MRHSEFKQMRKGIPMMSSRSIAILCAGLLAGVIGANSARAVSPLPVGASVDGKTTSAYIEDWWNWVGQFSAPDNPFTDTTGIDAVKHQAGPVFFIAGQSGFEDHAPVTRDFDLPAGRFLLVPIVNALVANGPDPGYPDTKTESDALTPGATDESSLLASIDGVDVPNPASYIQRSGTNFTLNLTDNNPIGFPAGTYTDANSSGFWLLLPPLSPGDHTLNFGGSVNALTTPGPNGITFPAYSINVTDRLHVVPLPRAALAALPMLLAIVGGIARRSRRSMLV